MEQISIFDVINELDETKGNWINVMDCFDKCKVLAYIPEDALSPLESGFNFYSEQWKKTNKKWSNYAVAIWRELGFVDDAWTKATNKLEEYRNQKRPCPMEIHRDDNFRPEHVVDYLKSEF